MLSDTGRTVFVTGGTGFVGSHVIDALLARGDKVVMLVRATSDLRWVEHHPPDRCVCVVGSLFDLSAPARFRDDITHIVHSAGVVKARSSDGYFRGNTEGTASLVEFALSLPNLRRLVHVSSQAAAGPALSPDRPVSESDPPRPVNAYGRSKLEAEKVVQAHAERLNAVVVRPSAVFGSRDTEMFQYFVSVKKHVLPVVGFGRSAVSFVHSDDLTAGILSALDVDVAPGSVYFISDPHVSSWPEFGRYAAAALGTWCITLRFPRLALYGTALLLETLVGLRGRTATLNRDKALMGVQPFWACDSSRAVNELGWQPGDDLSVRVAQTVEWYKSVGWL